MYAKGTEKENRQYIYNHYKLEEMKWITIDNYKTRTENIRKTNEVGTVYFLKKMRSTNAEDDMELS